MGFLYSKLLLFPLFSLIFQGVIANILNNRKVNFLNKVVWNKCGTLECTTIIVPINHSRKFSRLMGIALVKYPAKKQPAERTIIVAAGGPGGSGKKIVTQHGSVFSSIFDDKVDIIGFDARGVGDTKMISCINSHQFDGYTDSLQVFGASFLPKEASVDQCYYFAAGMKLHAELCIDNKKNQLEFISTDFIALDLEYIRKALEMDELNFWGFGYGSVLGLTYANMFPKNVGRMIFDGMINPNDYYGDHFSYFFF
jgi:pimeloyl-ACP methyl ester carboxylesterase